MELAYGLVNAQNLINKHALLTTDVTHARRPLSLPMKLPYVKLQVWDKDMLNPVRRNGRAQTAFCRLLSLVSTKCIGEERRRLRGGCQHRVDLPPRVSALHAVRAPPLLRLLTDRVFVLCLRVFARSSTHNTASTRNSRSRLTNRFAGVRWACVFGSLSDFRSVQWINMCHPNYGDKRTSSSRIAIAVFSLLSRETCCRDAAHETQLKASCRSRSTC